MTHLRDFKFQISHHYHPTEVHCRLLTQGKVLICPYASCHSCKIRFRTRPLPWQSLIGSGLRDSPCALIGGALCHPLAHARPLRGSGVPVCYLLVSRGQAPCLMLCRPLNGLNMSAHTVRGWEIPRGGSRGKTRAPHLAGRYSNSQGACPLDTSPTIHTNPASRVSGRA